MTTRSEFRFTLQRYEPIYCYIQRQLTKIASAKQARKEHVVHLNNMLQVFYVQRCKRQHTNHVT